MQHEETTDLRVERMLYAGTSLDRARAVFDGFLQQRPSARLTIRQRARVLRRAQ